jgi:hypothetical protein
MSNTYRVGKEKVLGGDDKSKPTLKSVRNQSLEDLSDTIDWEGSPSLEEVCLFLTSPESEAIVRQLCATQLMDNEQGGVETIRD